MILPEARFHTPAYNVRRKEGVDTLIIYWYGAGGRKKSVRVSLDGDKSREAAISICAGIDEHVEDHVILAHNSNEFLAKPSSDTAELAVDAYHDVLSSGACLLPKKICDPETHRMPLPVKVANDMIQSASPNP